MRRRSTGHLRQLRRALEGVERHRAQLPNGLSVVTVQAPHLHQAMLAVYVRTGSRHEPVAQMGISHLLEHLFFRGSARHPDSVAMNAAVEAAGGNLNAVTARDHGCYYTPLHPRALATGFEVIGDMLTRPKLTGLPVEKRVVLEEMMDEVDERGRDVDLDNLEKRALFPEHGLSNKVAGTPSTVRSMKPSWIRAHHEAHYRAGNLVLCAAGPIKHRHVVALAEEHFGALPKGPRNQEPPPAPLPAGPRLVAVDHADSPQTELRLSFLAPPEEHEDHPALLLARRVLDDGLSSRLPYEIVEKRGLAYDVHAEVEPFHDVAIFQLEAATRHANVPEVIERMAGVVAKLLRDGPTDEELERARARQAMGLEFMLDAPGELVGWYGGTELWRAAESPEERLLRFSTVTGEEIRRALGRVLRRDRLTAVLVGRCAKTTERRYQRLLERLPLP